ncbi:Gamma-aminobutyric acid type B receptor subunit 2 [Geodia barretti]|uniref:Gamma-aminobutyric acid type B receptor subunit 2 n=1 Tax=Geodia barretti TaxID=519541 RepID=A0AA35TEA3_GEOBA|nr:Gamma-aminobutyric acid type B receptor subunit 2 [Geodia barretti]
MKCFPVVSAALILAWAVASLVSGQDDLKTVYFSLIVSNGEYGYRSSGAVPSIDLALEAVREHAGSPGYNLTYETSGTLRTKEHSTCSSQQLLIQICRPIICEAAKRNLVYPHYGWIMYTWYPERWWTEEVAGEHIDECSDEEMEEFLVRAQPLLINLVPEPDDYNLQTVAGFSSREFIGNYTTRLWPESNYNHSSIFLMAFDALWSMAQMLNYTEEMRLRDLPRNHSDFDECRHLDGSLVPLDEFNYTNAFMGCMMRDNYYKVDFTGVSGLVRYSEDGTIIYTRIRLAQWRRVNVALDTVRFGYLDGDSNFSLVYDPGESDQTLYSEGYPPDGTPVAITNTYHTVLVVFYYFLAWSESPSPSSARIQLCLPQEKILKAWHLMCVVGTITGFGVLLIVAKTIAQALTSPQLVDDSEHSPGLTSPQFWRSTVCGQCYESGSIPFVLDLLIFVYLGLLQLVGIILAFQTRKVRIPILNDSKSVTALIYISSIVLVVIVLITFILRGYINICAAIFSAGSSYSPLSFSPQFHSKGLNLYRDPTGDKIFSEMHPTRQSQRSQLKDHQNSMAASMAELKDEEKVVLLNSHLANLNETLKDKSRRIAELESILKSST